MPKIKMTSVNVKKAAEDIFQVLMFDQWLRHNYIMEKDKKLFLEIPDNDMAEIRKEHPGLASLADIYATDEITYESSQATVFSFIGAKFDGSKYTPETIAKVMDSKDMKIEMYMFNLWIKRHEEYLDAERRSFSEWEEMYRGWLEMDQVKGYREKLMTSPVDGSQPESKSVH